MITVVVYVIFYAIAQVAFGAPNEDRFRFGDRREPEDSEYRTFHRRPYSGGGSNIENVFKIPIAVIKGTSAAAQALSPQNTQAIQTIFDIPVTTLDAVGNYIKETQPQGISDNNDDAIGAQRPLSLSDQRRQERRERILRLREEERERRRIMDEEKFFHPRPQSNFDIFSSLADLLGIGGGNRGGNYFGGHGHGHQGKPLKRPLRPSKPFKPGNHGSHGGSHGNLLGGNSQYQVNEPLNDVPLQSSGIFSWVQTTPNDESDDNGIQNKIAPGSEFRYDRERPEFRSF